MSERFMEIFMELFESVDRQGPGSRQTTCQALSLIDSLPEKPQILDVGCGAGSQSIVLANETGGIVTAVDNHQPFLDMLCGKIERLDLKGRIRCLNRDMNNLKMEPESFDLIWSEGAIYLMGFDLGLREWRPFLKEEGAIAISELTWFTDDRPKEAIAFWQEEYPQLRSVEENLTAMQGAGYEILGYFQLPDSDWTERFYPELEEQLEVIARKYPGEAEAMAVIESNRKEIGVFNKYSSTFGYCFYVGRKQQ